MSFAFPCLRHQLIAVSVVGLSMTSEWVLAQSALPPARSYHTDQYGRESKVVKERYQEDSQGEKQGIYLLYSPKGQLITRYNYTHGVKNGPAFVTEEDGFYAISWRLTVKAVGTYVNGKKDGWWDVYNVNRDGETGALDRRMKYVTGVLDYVTIYREGKMQAIYKYQQGRKDGLARVYGPTKEQYATGNYRNGEPDGEWTNAAIENNLISYRAGAKLVFEKGKLVTVTNPDGSVRSLAAEQLQKQAELAQAAADQKARELDARLSSLNPVEFHFATDSYALMGFGKTSLDTLAKQLNTRSRTPKYRVKDLYLVVNTNPLKSNATEASEKMLYILSLNRALVIRNYLLKQLDDKALNITVFACGGSNDRAYGEGAKMQLRGDLLKAQEVSERLATKYSIKPGNELIASTVLQESILAIIRAYFQSYQVRDEMLSKAEGETHVPEYLMKIPSEFWLTDLTGIVPENYATVEETAQFRSKVETLFAEMNRQYSRELNGKTIPPSVLFTSDLVRRTK